MFLNSTLRTLHAMMLAALLLPFAAASADDAAPRPPALDIYLLIGQSNMAGRDTRDLDQQIDDPLVLALDAQRRWVVARDPIHAKTGRIEPGVGPGIAFARAMRQFDASRAIGLVPMAVGGTQLRRWQRGGDLYEAALAQARHARSAGTLRGVLWHQGESDSANVSMAATYAVRLTQMFKDLRADLGQPDLPIVVGQLGAFIPIARAPGIETVCAALRQMPQQLPRVGYADSAGLGHLGDELHFSAEASRQLGRRYAQAMQALP